MSDLRHWKNPATGLISEATSVQAAAFPHLVEVSADTKPTHPLFVRSEADEQAEIERLSHAEITKEAEELGLTIPTSGTLAERRQALHDAIEAATGLGDGDDDLPEE